MVFDLILCRVLTGATQKALTWVDAYPARKCHKIRCHSGKHDGDSGSGALSPVLLA
jgi:hypothetical protein